MSEWPLVALGEVTSQSRDAVKVERDRRYPMLGVRWYAHGAFHRETVTPKAGTIYRVRPGQFIYNRLFAWKGSFGLVTEALAGSYVSNEFPLFDCDSERLLPAYLGCVFGRPAVWEHVEQVSTGTTASRNRWNEPAFNAYRIALPPLDEQHRIVAVMSAADAHIGALEAECRASRVLLRAARAERVNDPSIIPTVGMDAFSIVMGPQRSPARAVGPNMTRYLRSFNVGDGDLTLTDVKEMNFSPAEQKKFALMPGDVLVSEGSASENAVGMAAVWNGDLPGVVCFQKTLIRYRAIDGVSTPRFVNHWCKWAYEAGTFVERASGTNIKHITAIGAVNMPVALPSLERQEEVSAELDVVETTWHSLNAELAALRVVRADLLSALLSQEIVVDAAVDSFVKAA